MKELPPIPPRVFWSIVLLGILSIILTESRPQGGGLQHNWERGSVLQSRSIGLAMYSYANDNGGSYPDGKSSTEVFQKLLDGGYCDPDLFFIPFTGKTKPVAGQKLKPENVCWDVTAGVDSSAPDGLPIVFTTGFKVTYVPGGAAVPIIYPYPPFIPTWYQWWCQRPPVWPSHGIAVYYKDKNVISSRGKISNKGTSAVFLKPDTSANSDGSIPNFISPDFKPDGKTYRQLTPDGPLPH